MDIRQISYFILVYEERSFSRAAAKANVAQPTVSMQIKHLELEFGVVLFNRTRSGVEPTAHATRLYQHSVDIYRSFSLAKHELQEVGNLDKIKGEVRVGLPGSVSRGILTRVLTPYLSAFPDVNVTISEAYTGTLVEWVASGAVDFAIGSRPSEPRRLVQRLLYRDRVVLVSGACLNGPNFTPIDLTSTPGLSMILPSVSQSYGSFVRECIANNTIKTERTMEINGTTSSIVMALSSNWGVMAPFVSVVNEVANENRWGDFYIYPVVKPTIPFDLYLVYDERKPLTPAARHFIELIELEMKWVKTAWETMKARCNDGRLD